jgi:hypothetical protein
MTTRIDGKNQRTRKAPKGREERTIAKRDIAAQIRKTGAFDITAIFASAHLARFADGN